ncbi:MAG: type I glyceraldehyde-3-phosphate dehydrogenase, partial [Chloroflexi bacterium]|nr:type I glyceraldehyde-3-phosphate dehydrogenase [Chloroflexota bacterium]
SIADIVIVMKRETSVEEINEVLSKEAASERYQGILGVTNEPLVSSDIVGNAHASLVDLEMTQVVAGDLVKVMTWYDNEWGFTHQMIRQALEVLDNMAVAS